MRAALIAALVLTAAPARGQEPQFSCWDGSFAYTMAGWRADGAAGAVVRFTTQDVKMLQTILPDGAPDWGLAILDLPFPEGCATDPGRALFDCGAGSVTATLTHGGSVSRTETMPLPLTNVGAHLLRYEAASGVTGRIFLLEADLPGGPLTLAHEFGEHTTCDGWPDPFALP